MIVESLKICTALKMVLPLTLSLTFYLDDFMKIYHYLAPRRGLRGIVFTRSVCLSVCLSVCQSVCLSVFLCVCPADIWVFYFSAISRDIDLKFIQDTLYRVVLNSLKNDLHRSMVKVTGTVHCFLKVQSYHKNWAIEKFQCKTPIPKLLTLLKLSIKI